MDNEDFNWLLIQLSGLDDSLSCLWGAKMYAMMSGNRIHKEILEDFEVIQAQTENGFICPCLVEE